MRRADRWRLVAFWVLASSFAWGFALAPFVRRAVRDLIIATFRALSNPLTDNYPLSRWSRLLIYPVICWLAAWLLLTTTSQGRGTFASFT
jgi:hypothetical protein